jgi:hypothetical protein
MEITPTIQSEINNTFAQNETEEVISSGTSLTTQYIHKNEVLKHNCIEFIDAGWNFTGIFLLLE